MFEEERRRPRSLTVKISILAWEKRRHSAFAAGRSSELACLLLAGHPSSVFAHHAASALASPQKSETSHIPSEMASVLMLKD
ncbi:unnamed protein product, partial [Natator depressus]